MVLVGVVQHTVGRCAVPLGSGGAFLELGVVEVEQRQTLFVGALGVGLGMVGAGHPGDQQIGRREFAHRVVGVGVGVDQIGDPVLDMRVVGLVHLDLVAVVVGPDDGVESGGLDALGESAESREQVQRGRVVVTESSAAQRRSMFRCLRDDVPHDRRFLAHSILSGCL